MWIKIINGKKYGYESYKDCCNDINRYSVIFDGVFFLKSI